MDEPLTKSTAVYISSDVESSDSSSPERLVRTQTRSKDDSASPVKRAKCGPTEDDIEEIQCARSL